MLTTVLTNSSKCVDVIHMLLHTRYIMIIKGLHSLYMYDITQYRGSIYADFREWYISINTVNQDRLHFPFGSEKHHVHKNTINDHYVPELEIF